MRALFGTQCTVAHETAFAHAKPIGTPHGYPQGGELASASLPPADTSTGGELASASLPPADTS